MSVKLSSILPQYIKSPRLTLERYNSSAEHVKCCLEARNNPVIYAHIGDLGCYDQTNLEARHNSARIKKEKFGLDVDVDCFILYVLRVDVGENGLPLIGFVAMHQQLAERVPEIGYNLIPEFMNKGYATEAVISLCRAARETLGMGRLAVSALSTNLASLRVAEKAGFVKTGQTKVKDDGVVLDLLELPMDEP